VAGAELLALHHELHVFAGEGLFHGLAAYAQHHAEGVGLQFAHVVQDMSDERASADTM